MSDDPNLGTVPAAVEPPITAAVEGAAAVAAAPEGEAATVGGETSPASAHDEPTLLEQAAAPEKPAEAAVEEKPAEIAKDGEAAAETKPAEAGKPAEADAEPAAPEPLVYESLTLPEGVTLEAERVGEFDAIIAPHRLDPQARQQLAELHLAELQRQGERQAEQLSREQHQVWATTRKGWRSQLAEDAELGGDSFDTVNKRVAKVRDLFVPEAHRAAFDDFIRVTGAGDHPEFYRILDNIGRFLEEAAIAAPPNNPAPDRGGGAGRGRRPRDVMYDHPRSAT